MRTVDTEEMARLVAEKQAAIINVLDPQAFDKEHIPGSINIPVSRDDFVDAVRAKVKGEDQAVVVYCASEDCQASPKAARQLEEAGFSDVIDYAGGMAAWREADKAVASC